MHKNRRTFEQSDSDTEYKIGQMLIQRTFGSNVDRLHSRQHSK